MTDVWIRSSTIQDVTWYGFTVSAPGMNDIASWENFAEWVGDPIEAMHVLRRDFIGYTLHDDNRHILIRDRGDALRFGVWLFQLFEKDRIAASVKFLEKTWAEVLEEETRKHIYLDYESLGDMDRKRLSRQLKEPDTLLVGELGDMGYLPGGYY